MRVAAEQREAVAGAHGRERQQRAEIGDAPGDGITEAHRAGQVDQRDDRHRPARRELAHMQFAIRVAQRDAQIDAARVRLAQQRDMTAELALRALAMAGMRAGEDALRPPAQPVGDRLEGFLVHGAGTRAKTPAISSPTMRSRRSS